MVNTISIRELRPQLADVVENIHERFARYIVTRHGKPEVVMISVEDYESLLETLDVQSDKALMKSIKQAEKEIKTGKGVPLEKARKDLKVV